LIPTPRTTPASISKRCWH